MKITFELTEESYIDLVCALKRQYDFDMKYITEENKEPIENTKKFLNQLYELDPIEYTETLWWHFDNYEPLDF